MATFKLTIYYSGFCTRMVEAKDEEEAWEKSNADPELTTDEINEIVSSLEEWDEACHANEVNDEEVYDEEVDAPVPETPATEKSDDKGDEPGDRLLDALAASPFHWSFFAPPVDEIPWDSEYPNADVAATDSRFRDGQAAADTGKPVALKIFGIYCHYAENKESTPDIWILEAGRFDEADPDLVGCVTIKDWEWKQHIGGDDGFSDDHLLEILFDEVYTLEHNMYLVRKTRQQKNTAESASDEVDDLGVRADGDLGVRADGDLIEYLRSVDPLGNAPELFDLYHIWRALHAIQMEIVSGAEVYPSVSATLNAIMAITDTLVDKITDGDTDVPEEYIINQFKH